MPQKIKGKIHVKVNPESLLRQPKLAACIGIISSTWAEIEDELAFLFIAGVQTEPAIAAAILGNAFSIAVRLKMIRTAMGLRFPSKAVQPFDVLCKKIRKRANERNHIVHGMWTTHKDHPRALLRLAGITDPTLKIEKYVLRDFAGIQIRLLDLYLDLCKFRQSLAPFVTATDAEKRADFWLLSAPAQDKAGPRSRRPLSGPSQSRQSREPRPKTQTQD